MGTIYGTPGNDYLPGTEEDDRIYGDEGEDILIGGSGDDYLVGGSGNDTLTGGGGQDTFVLYYSGGGIDTITDFSVEEDYISVQSAPHEPISGDFINSNKFTVGSPKLKSSQNVLVQGSIVKDNASKISKYIKSITSSPVDEPSKDVPILGGIFTYNNSTGALFYDEQQLAWLPSNLYRSIIRTTDIGVIADSAVYHHSNSNILMR